MTGLRVFRISEGMIENGDSDVMMMMMMMAGTLRDEDEQDTSEEAADIARDDEDQDGNSERRIPADSAVKRLHESGIIKAATLFERRSLQLPSEKFRDLQQDPNPRP